MATRFVDRHDRRSARHAGVPVGVSRYRSTPERLDVPFREYDSSQSTLCGFDIETCETIHSASGFAYRIDDVFTFSGDTVVSESVARFADGSSVLVHDCAYYDEEEMNHATPHQLGQTLADVDIDDFYLAHFYPDAAANADAMRRTVSEYVPATVHIPADLETIQIQASE
ncbi:MBL fold metallo-hydrolase [Halalkalicoccus salilacus]|uniref:MBL fold metallo-hydrolase n=1 Tax=Halalkalicoccus sp. GCM10025704 TaxID=3252662 RepID=UPI0036143BEC